MPRKDPPDETRKEPLRNALFVAAVSGVLGFAGGFAVENYKGYSERRAAASVFAGEIGAILRMFELRQYRTELEALKHGQGASPALAPSNAKPEADEVYSAYVDRLGLLPGDQSEQVVRFYTLLNGVRVDYRRILSDEFKDAPDRKVDRIDKALKLWDEAESIGRTLAADLKKLAARSWPW